MTTIHDQVQDAVDFFEGNGLYHLPYTKREGERLFYCFWEQKYTKENFKKVVQDILHKYRIGEVLTAIDDIPVRFALKFHAASDLKIGACVTEIFVNKNPNGFPGPCFHVRRFDASTEDFSIEKCFRTKTSTERFAEACRAAVVPIIRAFALDHDIPKGYEVHHGGKYEFRHILELFIDQEDIDVADHGWESVSDEERLRPELEKRFITLHNKLAVLEALPKDEHKKITLQTFRKAA